MDVLVTPASSPGEVWNLTDRLGRKVRRITHSAENGFVITFTDQSADWPQSKIDTVQPTLDSAMDPIALRLKGVCVS